MTDNPQNLADALVRLGRGPEVEGRHVNMPITQGSTMVFNTLAAFEAARGERFAHGTLYYGRYGNATTFELERMFAALEGAHGAVAVSSGLSAISLALTAVSHAGAHLLVADNVYRPNREFCETTLSRFGVEVDFFDPMIGAGVGALIRPETTAVVFEAPGSGTFEVPDIPAIAKAARDRGAISMIDNTWATPVFCQPLALGVDVSIHSATKYICGHSDAMLGLIACNEATFDRIRRTCLGFGERPGSQDVFLALRGLRTLKMRLERAQASGLQVARWLADQPQVRRVLHPAFPDCPGHANWKRDFTGASGLFGIVTKPATDAQLHAFIDALEMFGVGVSWGGFESLVLPVTPHRTAVPWTEEGRVIRFSIGHEDPESLIADLAQAIGHLG